MKQANPPAARLPTVRCAGVPLTPLAPAAAAAALVHLAGDGAPADVHLCGAGTLARADRDAGLQRTLRTATLCLPEGRAVVWANRLGSGSRSQPPDRVAGADLLLDTVRAGLKGGLRHYLIGSDAGTVRQLTEEVLVRYPGARIAGADSLPGHRLTTEQRDGLSVRIAGSGAQLVWIGPEAGDPHTLAARLAAAHPVEHPAVYIAVGAAFGIICGSRPAGPPLTRWRRTLRGHTHFVRVAAREERRGRGPYRELAALLRDAEVDLVLDAGADGGDYPVELRRAGYRGRIVSFEVLPRPRAELTRRARDDPGWTVLPYALGDGLGPRGGHRLDALWDAVTAPGERLFVRLRTPGHATAVLRGAGRYAPDCVGLQAGGGGSGPVPGYETALTLGRHDVVLFRRSDLPPG